MSHQSNVATSSQAEGTVAASLSTVRDHEVPIQVGCPDERAVQVDSDIGCFHA